MNQSESEDFDFEPNNNQFFEGLFQAPKLRAKEKNLRQEIIKQSEQSSKSKATTLEEKVNKRSQKIKSIVREEHMNMQQESYKEQIPVQKKKQTIHSKTFEDLRLIKPLLKAINDAEYIRPTPIQTLAIPSILSGKDVVASSITGSGKTAAFLLPILQRYYNAVPVGYIRALIVTPTRQLAVQIFEHFQMLNKYVRIQAVLAIGANSLKSQQQALRNNPQVVIATPGRIIDLLINSRSIGLQNLQILVFDQADKLLELGFKAQIQQMMRYLNRQAQTILFSATMGKQIKQLAQDTTKKPIRISADPDNKTAEKLHQQMFKIKQQSEQYREAALLSVLEYLYKEKVLVFFKTKKQCHRMAIILTMLGKKVCELHGNLSQTQRIQAFMKFKEGQYDYMMATDLASRGLDIKQIKTVINFELPPQLTRYIHRIGRTARAGNTGNSLTLCNDQQCRQLKKMMRKTGDKLYRINLTESTIQSQKKTIIEMQKNIEEILNEQRQQRHLRKAQMQLQKLNNINEHQNEIYSRPKKEWFITEKEKKQLQKKAKEEAGIKPQPQQPKKFKKIFKGNRKQWKK